jgi:hypothetical protein
MRLVREQADIAANARAAGRRRRPARIGQPPYARGAAT